MQHTVLYFSIAGFVLYFTGIVLFRTDCRLELTSGLLSRDRFVRGTEIVIFSMLSSLPTGKFLFTAPGTLGVKEVSPEERFLTSMFKFEPCSIRGEALPVDGRLLRGE